MKRTALLFFLTAAAAAQETVVVTATRLPDYPPPGTFVLTHQDWEGASNLLDALERIPGLRLIQAGSASTATFIAKGFGESGHTRLRVLVDGLPVNAPDLALPALGSLPLASIERIEWVPSAGTARWGDGSVAGVLNIVTRSEADKPEYELRLSADSTYGNAAEGRLAFPAGDHRFFLSGWRLQLLPERERSDSLGWGGSARWVWELPFLKLSLGFLVDPSEDQLPGSLTPQQFAADPNQAVTASDRTGRFSWRTDIELGNSSRQETGLIWNSPAAWTRRESEADYSAYSSYTTTVLSDVAWYPVVRWTSEQPGEAVPSYDLGADINYSRLELTRYTSAGRENVSGTADTQRWLYGGFFGVQYQWLPYNIGLDLRLQQARYSGGGSATGDDTLTAFGFSGKTGFQDGFQSYYLQAAQVFRLPLLDEKISYYGFGDAFLKELGPEQGYSWDLGAAWDWGSIRLDLQIFLLFMREEIAYDSALMRNVNQGHSRRLGARPSFEGKFEWFTLYLSYGWTDARSGWDLDASQKFLPLVPAHDAEAAVQLNLPLGFSLHPGLSWNGPVFFNKTASKSLPSRTVWNTRLSWKGSWLEGGWNISLSALNILDDRTPTSAFEGFMNDGYYPSPGRTFQLGLEARW